MHILRSSLWSLILVFSSANAQSNPDSSCSFVVFTHEWRDATAADYDSDDWRAFKKFTNVQTPWRVEGDFNGDSLPDVARVAIKDADQTWMLGVEFGAKQGEKCETFQIMQGLPNQLQSLPSLQVLPKVTNKLKCHHAGQSYPVLCEIPPDGPIANLKHDSIIVSDAVTARVPSAFYWAQWDNKTKTDGSPLMVFLQTPLNVAIDMN